MVEQARTANPALVIVAKAHSRDAAEHLRALGAPLIVLGEREIARRMLERGLEADPPMAPDAAAMPAAG